MSVVVAQDLQKSFRFRPYARGTLTLKSALLDAILFRPRPPLITREAVRGVSFTLEPGEALGLVGPNGAGKTTLLRLIAGIYRPDGGSVTIEGRIGPMLNLGAGFHPDLSGFENAEVAALVGGMTRQEFTGALDAIVAFSELEDAMDAPVRTYSTGMTLRLGFAVASALAPDLLLIDEVLAVGDLSFQLKCLERIKQLRAEGTALIVASHNLVVIEDLCGRALQIEAGEVARSGSSHDVCQAYLEQSAQAAPPPPP